MTDTTGAGIARKVGAVAVVGGGIAGVQASLDLADMRFAVHLIERTPSSDRLF